MLTSKKPILGAFFLAVLVLSFLLNIHPASCYTIVDSDIEDRPYSRVEVMLSKVPEIVGDRDFYQLWLSVGKQKPNDHSAGPLTVYVSVFLPSYADDISSSFSAYVPFSLDPAQQQSFRPEAIRYGNFCIAYWTVSSAHGPLAKDWLFTDHASYFLDFTVPQKEPATADIYVDIVYYSYNLLYFLKIVDEQAYGLHVESSIANVAPPHVLGSDDHSLFITPFGVDAMVASIMVGAVVLYRRKRRQVVPTLQGTGGADTAQPSASRIGRVPWGVIVLFGFNLLFGSLYVLFGLLNIEWSPSSAGSMIFYGIVMVATAFGLMRMSTWAWFAAVIINIMCLIEHYVLFPNFAVLTIPLEPFILAYLFLKHDAFRV